MDKKNGKTGNIYESSFLHIIENLLGRFGVRNLAPRIGVPTNIFVRSDRNHFLHQPLSGEQIQEAQRKAVQDLAFIISQPNLNEKCEKVFHWKCCFYNLWEIKKDYFKGDNISFIEFTEKRALQAFYCDKKLDELLYKINPAYKQTVLLYNKASEKTDEIVEDLDDCRSIEKL